jgi:23S rRNA (cytidine1920-2'-O)/16S rRNA (cytidine1409-2'-O)-methyltransferase
VAARQRLDAEMVRRGLADSRADATRAIDAGRVLVNGAQADKSARLVAPADAVVITGPPPRFVSRGGDKLDAALERFRIDLNGCRVLDAGASTGGFTDCALQRGARQVVAVDVGHGQLHPRLRSDSRVVVMEHTHVGDLSAELIGGRVDLVVADLSFISLTKVLAPLIAVCQPGAPMVLLVKPQFEAGRVEVSRGRGVITDPRVRAAATARAAAALVDHDAVIAGWCRSPIHGAQGNAEFLVYAHAPGNVTWGLR